MKYFSKIPSKSQWLRRNTASGGIIVSTVVTLLLVILSFSLGYLIGKGRKVENAEVKQPGSVEEIVRQELANRPPTPQTKQDYEFFEKLTGDSKQTVREKVVPPPSGPYIIQFAAFKEEAPARQMQAKFKKASVDVVVERVEVAGKGKLWRVRSSTFPDAEGAKRQAEVIKKKTNASYLVRKLN